MNAFLLSLMMTFGPAADHDLEPQDGLPRAETAKAKPIPPNCTINPWTGKWTCHKWPDTVKPPKV